MSVLPPTITAVEVNLRQYNTEAIRRELLQVGFSEVITSSFSNKDIIELQNALASDKRFVRGNLTQNISKALDQNFVHCDLLDIPHVRVFEIGTIFDKTDTSVSEHIAIALGVRTKGNGYNSKDDAILETARETVEQLLGTTLEWKNEKGVAEANLSAVWSNLTKPSHYEAYAPSIPAQFKAISTYPAVSRDIALWVSDGVVSSEVEALIAQTAGELCVRISLFDSFSKDGRTSYGFRLVFQSFERTLTDVEVNTFMEPVYGAVAGKGWEVR